MHKLGTKIILKHFYKYSSYEFMPIYKVDDPSKIDII
jgi:hypothetical protein